MITGTKTAPLATADLIDLYENPDQFVVFDYAGSTLKGEGFFTFVGNTKINCELTNYKDLSYEERKELLNSFIDWSYSLHISTLQKALISVLADLNDPSLESDFFSKDEIELYRNEYKEELEAIRGFHYSMLLMIPSIAVDFKKLIDAEIEAGLIRVIKGLDDVGPNVYNLIFFPKFLDLFIGTSEERPVAYYEDVISTYRYKDMGFFEALTSDKTYPALIAIFNMFFSEDEPVTGVA